MQTLSVSVYPTVFAFLFFYVNFWDVFIRLSYILSVCTVSNVPIAVIGVLQVDNEKSA